ncbi:hypothetical protein KIPB_010010, partial [Kipferlia bialata]
YPGLWALMIHIFSHWLWECKAYWISRCISQVMRFLTGIEIHPGATIGKFVFIDHGSGVVIGETAIVGDHCLLYQGVTLGGTGGETGKRHPTLGKYVVVGAGAKILGNIEISDHVRVGACSVVVKPVPAGATVVGIPGRVVRRRRVEGVPETYSFPQEGAKVPSKPKAPTPAASPMAQAKDSREGTFLPKAPAKPVKRERGHMVRDSMRSMSDAFLGKRPSAMDSLQVADEESHAEAEREREAERVRADQSPEERAEGFYKLSLQDRPSAEFLGAHEQSWLRHDFLPDANVQHDADLIVVSRHVREMEDKIHRLESMCKMFTERLACSPCMSPPEDQSPSWLSVIAQRDIKQVESGWLDTDHAPLMLEEMCQRCSCSNLETVMPYAELRSPTHRNARDLEAEVQRDMYLEVEERRRTSCLQSVMMPGDMSPVAETPSPEGEREAEAEAEAEAEREGHCAREMDQIADSLVDCDCSDRED